MGLMNKLFGGGTKLELKLDANQIPEGGLLSGNVLLHGGKKPLKLTSLKVRLVYVKVTSVPGQSLPKIDMQILIDNAVAANADLPPASLNKFSFTLNVPKGTDPKGSYKVIAVADIPGVADPSADADLKVLPAVQRGFFGQAKGPEAITADDLFQRFPGLRASDENSITDALHNVLLAAYDPEDNLVAAEPLLARFMREGSERVRESALRAWGTILNNRARPEHIKALEAMSKDPGTTPRLMREVIAVAAKFAEEGALPLVEQMTRHQDPDVRAELATQLYLNADPKLRERKAFLLLLARDPDAGVRANAFASFSTFAEDPQVVNLAVEAINRDTSPDVQKACVRAISPAHYYGQKDLAFNTLLAHTKNPHAEVRQEIADACHWLPADPRLAQIVGALLVDQSVEVRRRMAWQSVNMSEHPELAQMFIKVATQDPSLEVRADALHGMSKLMPVGDAVAFYRQRLAQDVSEAVGYGVVNGLRDHKDEPAARQLLTELGSSQYSRVAQYARETLKD
jgi:hypothetical protein